MDRRSQFFAIGAVVCFVLVPVALPEHRQLAIVAGCVYAALALATWLEAVTRTRR